MLHTTDVFHILLSFFKAALTHVFISTMAQMTLCNERITGRHLQLLSVTQSLKRLSAHCLGFTTHSLTVLVNSCQSHQPLFPAGSILAKKKKVVITARATSRKVIV